MDFQTTFYPEVKYGGFSNSDGTILFYTRINALVKNTDTIVDVGCGRGGYANDPVSYRQHLRIMKGKCAKVIGIDVNGHALQNPFINEFRLIEDSRWPIQSNSVDICLVDNVLEHLQFPEILFAESSRVLKPSGHLCLRTPNILSYFGIISKLIPTNKHSQVLLKLKQTDPEDIFPTYYSCNTILSIKRLLKKYNFTGCVYGHDPEPAYLQFSKLLYFLGVIHQHLVPQIFKVSIHAYARKN
jgi:SAM-dependent methyltransferase